MNLQDLVPPWELCELIPKGEFRDSFFCYVWCSFREEYLICKSDWEHTQDICYPAPTLQEILAKFVVWHMKDKNNESKGNIISGLTENFGVNNVVCKWYPIPKTAEEAMKLWLELKGINKK